MKNYKGYTGVNTAERIKIEANRELERSLTSYNSTKVIITPNGDFSRQFESEVILLQRYDSDGDVRKVIGRIHEIERGNFIHVDNDIWLVTSKPEDNGTYRKAELTLCSANFPIDEDDVEVIIGYDKFGRPIYETIPGGIEYFPCVAQISDALATAVEVNEPINLLNNQIRITMPYRESKSIYYNEKFNMYGDEYRIVKLDRTKSIDTIGLLIVTGVRLTEEGDYNEYS